MKGMVDLGMKNVGCLRICLTFLTDFQGLQ